ncbi:hypothetical protein cypCar_00000120, partial [Cyprinus carpio]
LADGRDRCWCLKSLKKRVPREEIEEFSIFPRRSKCDTVEIILTLKPVNKSTEVVQRCLSPETKQGINLQTCWNNKNTNNTPNFCKISTACRTVINESARGAQETEGIWKL